MRSAFLRGPALLVPVVLALLAGALCDRLWARDARAQSSSTSSVLVPWEGLVFRTPDGVAIARLSRDVHGGVLELYGDRQDGVARFSSTPLAAPRPAQREPYVLDDEDPWKSRGRAARPQVGF